MPRTGNVLVSVVAILPTSLHCMRLQWTYPSLYVCSAVHFSGTCAFDKISTHAYVVNQNQNPFYKYIIHNTKYCFVRDSNVDCRWCVGAGV